MPTDPLDELLDDLAARGRPSLPWLVRWTAEGGDPVARAWRASADPGAMLAFAARAGRTDPAAAVCVDAGHWLPRFAGFRARAERDAAERAFASAALLLRAGRMVSLRGEISRAIARWPVAGLAACEALRTALPAVITVEQLLAG